MERVAEIDDAGNPVEVVLIDEHVPVIGVIVDDLGTQAGETGCHGDVEMVEQAAQKRAVGDIGNMVQALARGAGLADVPVEAPDRAGMDEALQRAVEPAERAAEIFEQLRGARRFGQRQARQPGHQPQRMALARGTGRFRERRTVGGRLEAGSGDARAREMIEQGDLEFAFGGRLAGIDDFENPLGAVVGRELEVLVALAVEGCDAPTHAKPARRQLGGLAKGECRRGMGHVGHGLSGIAVTGAWHGPKNRASGKASVAPAL
jgi:hypothetical protein